MNILAFFLFFLIAIGILTAANFFIYHILVSSFSWQNWIHKKWLLGALLSLSCCFILASIITHLQESIVVKYFYIAAASWLGFFVYLFLFSLFGQLIKPILSGAGLNVNGKIIGIIILTASLGYSIYGIWNARHLNIKEIKIEIKNLPSEWENKTAVQITDAHLGSVYGANYMNNLAEKINSLKPNIIFITGDLFDGMDGSLNTFIESLNKLQAPKGTYFITGNHETYLGKEKISEVLRKTKIDILDDKIVNINGLQIIGMSYGSEVRKRNLEKDILAHKEYITGQPTILLYHSPQNIEEAKKIGVNLQLSGHTHKGQLFPFNFITKLIYGGYDYGLFYDGDYSLYTSGGVGTWGPPMQTSVKPEIVKIKFVKKIAYENIY